MRKLILIRHSLPEIIPSRPANQWRLSGEGRLRCQWLAARLASYSIETLIASSEPKAQETAQLTADVLGIAWETVEGLHEHDRSSVPFFTSREDFRAAVAELFGRPEELVFGAETADQAHARFTRAVARLLTERTGTLAIVTHGTVMTLFVTRATGLTPLPFWRQLEMPSYAVLSLPVFDLLELIGLEQLHSGCGPHQEESGDTDQL